MGDVAVDTTCLNLIKHVISADGRNAAEIIFLLSND